MEKKTYIKPQIRIVGCNEIMTAFTSHSSDGSGAMIKKSDNIYDVDDGRTTIGTSQSTIHGVSLWDDEADGLNE